MNERALAKNYFIKRRLILLSILIFSLIFSYGCYTVKITPVAKQPEKFLPVKATIIIPPETKNYTYKFRSWAAGIGNRWKVLVGDAVCQYSDAYLPSLFPQGNDLNLTLIINNYKVSRFRSIIDLNFKIDKSGKVVFDKTYHGDGTSKSGAVIWGGVFAMKGVVSSTLHEILKEIFEQFVADARAQYSSWQ